MTQIKLPPTNPGGFSKAISTVLTGGNPAQTPLNLNYSGWNA